MSCVISQSQIATDKEDCDVFFRSENLVIMLEASLQLDWKQRFQLTKIFSPSL